MANGTDSKDLDVEELLDYCEQYDHILSPWEREFIDDLQQGLGESELSERQHEKLLQIYDKVRDRVGR